MLWKSGMIRWHEVLHGTWWSQFVGMLHLVTVTASLAPFVLWVGNESWSAFAWLTHGKTNDVPTILLWTGLGWDYWGEMVCPPFQFLVFCTDWLARSSTRGLLTGQHHKKHFATMTTNLLAFDLLCIKIFFAFHCLRSHSDHAEASIPQ